MKRIIAKNFTMLSLGMVSIMANAGERQKWTDGHGDLQVGYHDHSWDWGVWVDNAVDEVIVSLGEDSKALIPDNPNFDFIGNPGDPVWIAPQVDREGVIFFGMNTSSTPQGTFVNNRMDFRLNSVEGPGDFLVWTTGGAGSVEVSFNSRDGIDGNDAINAPAPGHWHQNWGFTSPGTYHVGFTASGTLVGESTAITSEEEIYRFAVNVFDRGELDMEVAYEDGEWELVLLDEANEREIEAGEAALHASPGTWQVVPSDPAFSFLGNPGDGVYILPQEEKEGILFLGIAGDEIETGVFENDQVSLNLSSVDGPGSVYLYSTDAFGAPTKYFDSGDGISESDQFPLNVGGHSHQNWAFSAPGIYRVGLNASGVLADGTPSKSEDTLFLFEVFGPTIFGEGELDLEVAYEDGEWELVGLDEANEREICAEELVILGNNSTRTVVPEDPAFAFLGAAGGTVNVLPQDETEGAIFLGIAGDEIESGVFENNLVQLKLVSVDGPGDVSLYAVDSFGSPRVYFYSGDGISDGDAFPVSVGGHSHQNWGFTQPGLYRVDLQATGQLTGSGAAAASDVVTFTFNIQSTTPMMFGEGEIDLEVAYEDGEWELVLLDEANETEIEAGDAILHASAATWQAVPTEAAFEFLGNPGDSIYILPQEEKEGILFLGIAGDEIEAGVFQNDQVGLNLSSVDGPGAVFLYSTDAFGAPTTYFNSADGISNEDVFPVSVGGHSHQNWAFSSPGTYRIGLNASGVLADGTAIKSDDTVFQFEVTGPTIFGQGELDLEVAYEDGEFELVLLDEANEREIEAADGILTGVASTLEPVPNDPAFGFLGNPGDRIFILPQDEQEGVLFLGIAGDEIPAGEFQNDMVGLNLVGVDGPGDVYLYATDAFGAPETFFNSANGLDASDTYPVNVGGHAHQNWGFSAAGAYEVTLQASGNKAGNGESVASEPVSFFFEVIEPDVYNMGELDMEVAYEDGEWELILLDEAAEREVEPEGALLQGVSAVIQSVPDNPAYNFLGQSGNAVWVLPQEETEGVLFLGIAGDEIEGGVFTDDSVDLKLIDVRGPGNVSLYAVDEFGAPTVYMNSADGIDDSDAFPVTVGGHSHQNWGFTAPGVYKVALQASGTLAEGAQAIQSQIVEFTFELLNVSSRLNIARGNNNSLVLSSASLPGASYQLQSRAVFGGGEWMDQGDPVSGTGEMIEFEVPVLTDVESVFYRLWIIPSDTP